MPARIVQPSAAALSEAAQILRRGGLVAFPTETVYGLGAHALDSDAVARIFAAKGRPADNPVIVHVASLAAARRLAADWPDAATRLGEAYWPGPLTLVVERAPAVPDAVTAGGNTVGLRVPDHPVALALLREAGCPVAAPSANRSESISPTTARHVLESLGSRVEDLLILDGGPCRVGVESTVVDVTGGAPVVLRPGMLRLDPEGPSGGRSGADTASQADAQPPGSPARVARSPGQRSRHYAPSKPLRIVSPEALEAEIGPGDAVLKLPPDPAAAAARLYAELRRLESEASVARILVARPPQTAEWEAISDRLRRAASDGGRDGR